MEGFEFETKNLGYSSIELPICRHYDLGYPSSSNFMKLTEGEDQSITIVADKGCIDCSLFVCKKRDSENYLVSVGCVSVKRNKR